MKSETRLRFFEAMLLFFFRYMGFDLHYSRRDYERCRYLSYLLPLAAFWKVIRTILWSSKYFVDNVKYRKWRFYLTFCLSFFESDEGFHSELSASKQ